MSKEKSAAKRGTKEGESRITIICNDEQISDLKALAFYDRVKEKEIVYTAFKTYLDTRVGDIEEAKRIYTHKK
jgi:hypothetical protein